MKKLYLAGLILAAAVSGCSGHSQGDSVTPEEAVTEESTEAGDEESGMSAEQEATSFTAVPDGLQEANGMVAYGTDLYFADGNILWRVNRENGGKTELIGADGGAVLENFCVNEGDVYASVSDRWRSGSQLWLYRADTGEISVLEDPGEDGKYISSIYALDGVLYLRYTDSFKGYPIEEDGGLGEEIPQDQLAYNLPEGYFVWNLNGFAPYAAAHGTDPVLMSAAEDGTNGVLYRQNLETGELTELKGLSAGGNAPLEADGQIFYGGGDGGPGELSAYDLETGRTRKLYSAGEDCLLRPMQYRDGMIYCSVTKSEPAGAGDSQQYLQIDTETGEETVLAALTEEAGQSEFQRLFYTPYFYADEDGFWYFETVENGQQKVVKRTPSAEDAWTDPVLRQSKTAAAGTVSAWQENIRSEDGSRTVLEAYVEQLTLNGSMPGDEAVNGILETQAKARQQYCGQELLGDMDPEYVQRDDFTPNTYASVVNVTYDDGRYICVGYEGYEYPSGAAHGMPFREYHVFDRQEGRELSLPDMISNTEEELKEIVSPYFEEPARAGATFQGPEETAEEVRERIGFDSDFYLTDGGIVFYYAPYDLGPYASGFIEVTVPFDQLMWKIEL